MMSARPEAPAPLILHRGPPLGLVAAVYTALFLASLYPVVSFSGGAHFPAPWVPGSMLATFFQEHPHRTLWCAVLQFGAAIPLGIFTATVVSRLHFLGARVAGVHIALFGGLMATMNIATASLVLWVMAYPGIADDAAVLRALYYLTFSVGGVGFSVPFGLLIAGVCIPASFMQALPRWLVIVGLAVAICGVMSWLSLLIPQFIALIPLTRFPGFLWLIAAGIALPRGRLAWRGEIIGDSRQ
jgi:hypothetical protein